MICQTTALLIILSVLVAILLFIGYKESGWKGVIVVAVSLIIGSAFLIGFGFLISLLPKC